MKKHTPKEAIDIITAAECGAISRLQVVAIERVGKTYGWGITDHVRSRLNTGDLAVRLREGRIDADEVRAEIDGRVRDAALALFDKMAATREIPGLAGLRKHVSHGRGEDHVD